MTRPHKSPFGINWSDLEEVKAYADGLARSGLDQTVFKHPQRSNYNITFTQRTDRYRPDWVVYQTGREVMA